MDDNNEFDEDSARVMGLYQQYLSLRSSQILKILENMDLYKDQILNYCQIIYDFLNQLSGLLPHDNKKLRKKLAKNKWIKIFFNNSIMQYEIHEDYCTYLIYNKISIPNNQYHQQYQTDILKLFEAQLFQYIIKINEKFYNNMFQINQQSQNQIQLQSEDFKYFQIIEHLSYHIDDLLTQQEQLNIENLMVILAQQIIKNEYQTVCDFIQNYYKDFITNTQMVPSQYPEDLSYNNFGQGQQALDLKQNKQHKILQIQDSQDINNLSIGVYSIKVKKSIIILEIKNHEKSAYIINYFHHYKNKSSIFDKLSNFKVWRIRTIKLSVEEAYTLIKCLKLKNQFQQQQNQIIEIYKQQEFEAINNQLVQKIQQKKDIIEKIKMVISKIIPKFQNYKDIFSLEFVLKLQQEKQFDFELIQRIDSDFDLNKLQFSQQAFGTIYEDKFKLTSAVVIYPNQNHILVFLRDTKDIGLEDSQNGLKQINENVQIIVNKQRINCHSQDYVEYYLMIKKLKKDQKYIIISLTNIKVIPSQVAQFYVSLLLYKSENNIWKMVKDFLEIKYDVWNSILNFLD